MKIIYLQSWKGFIIWKTHNRSAELPYYWLILRKLRSVTCICCMKNLIMIEFRNHLAVFLLRGEYIVNNMVTDKLNVYKEMGYCDYFNNRARGMGRERSSLEQFDNYHVLTEQETRIQKQIMLEHENSYTDNKNVLYLHIPFCLTRCDFCPYYVEKYNRDKVLEYLAALSEEIEIISRTNYAGTTKFQCLYIGGGTPSVLDAAAIEKLLKLIKSNFQFMEDAEFTFESNVTTLSEEKIIKMKESGINRVSLGIQTLNDRLLKELGCAHNTVIAKKMIDLLLKYKMKVNLDFIFGLVNQSTEEVLQDLKQISEMSGLEQLTFFPLKIMPNTKLALLLDSEKIDIKEHTANLLLLDKIIEEEFNKLGFEREQSPVFYHKKGTPEHRYVSTGTRVLGLGASAGTLIDYGEFSNYSRVDDYIASIKNTGCGSPFCGPITMQQAYERYILYSIIYLNRSVPDSKGIIELNFREYYGIEMGDKYDKVLEDLRRLRFVKVGDDGKISFTQRMWHVLSMEKIGMPSII